MPPSYSLAFEDTRGHCYLARDGMPEFVSEYPNATGYWVQRNQSSDYHRSLTNLLAAGQVGWNVASYCLSSVDFRIFDLLVWIPRPYWSAPPDPFRPREKTARQLLQDMDNEERKMLEKLREQMRKRRVKAMNPYRGLPDAD